MTLTELRPGDRIRGFEAFGCIPASAVRVVRVCDDGLYVKCREGMHLLDGQASAGGNLVGLSLALSADDRVPDLQA